MDNLDGTVTLPRGAEALYEWLLLRPDFVNHERDLRFLRLAVVVGKIDFCSSLTF